MNRPSKLASAATAGGLSVLFMAVYGGCNWITAQRHDVGTWYYPWEHFIPFVPLMIVPYMSIDLFFFAAPFICHSREEMRTLARRIAFAILVAGVCFLALPLKMATPCPPVAGWMGAVFNFLHGFDQPYNLVPSLHITLRTILADLYARHTRGPLRAASHFWFSLIGFSTVLTYQHHIVDVIAGFVLAAVCFYLFREQKPQPTAATNPRIGVYYLAGAGACLVVVYFGWPWAAIMLWPAMALSIVATAYWGIGSGIYRKENGQLPLSSRVLLAPCLFGQWISLLHYRRQGNLWDKLTPQVWIGTVLNEQQAREAARQGVSAVLDLTCESSENKTFRSLDYRNLAILDLTRLTPAQLREAAEFIEQRAARGAVYVHCKAGYSRTAAAVGAYLLATKKAKSVEECFTMMRQARPAMIFRPEVKVALEQFARDESRRSQPDDHSNLSLTAA